MNNVSSIENFLVQKEIYSNEVRNQIDDIINKSNSCIFPVLDIYNNNENNKEKNSVNIHENKFKKIMLISKPKKLINKQENEFYKFFKSKSLTDLRMDN